MPENQRRIPKKRKESKIIMLLNRILRNQAEARDNISQKSLDAFHASVRKLKALGKKSL